MHIYRVTGYTCVLEDARIANVVMSAGQISREGLITSATKRILTFSELIVKDEKISDLVVFGKERNGRAVIAPDEIVYKNLTRVPWFKEDQWKALNLFEPIPVPVLREVWFIPSRDAEGERRWVLSHGKQVMPSHFIPRPNEVAREYQDEIKEARERQRG